MRKEGVQFQAISCGKLRRYFDLKNFSDVFRIVAGFFQAVRILRKFQPEKVFVKGGFVSLPVAVAAFILRIPVIVHESDFSPGLANRIAAKFARKICVSFEDSSQFFKKTKVIYTGPPVRESVLCGSEEKGRKFLGFDKFRPVLLVMGGSLGARQLNELVRGNLDELLKKFQIVHLCGRGNLDISIKKKGYKQFEYINENIGDIYAASSVCVSRAGANSLAELALNKKKALIIPLDSGASRGDQIENAKAYAKMINWSILEGKIEGKQFLEALFLLINQDLRISMKIENGTRAVNNLLHED